MIAMKRIFKYALSVLALSAMFSCTTEKVQYDFEKNPGVAATFAAKTLQVPGLVAEDGGKVSVPLYRGNTAEAAQVAVAVTGGEGIFTPTSSTVDFEAGENVAYLTFTYDFDALSAKPETLTATIVNEADLALNAVASASFTLVKQLTYVPLESPGYYFTGFFGEGWDQTIYKAEEGNYFTLPGCWYSGYDFSFFFDGTNLDWYTATTGYSYGSYGPVEFRLTDYLVTEDEGCMVLVLYMDYVLPEVDDFVLYSGYEAVYFPAGFTF